LKNVQVCEYKKYYNHVKHEKKCAMEKNPRNKIAEVVIADITNSFTTENVIFAHFTINVLI